jgi:hypothetical protein
MRGGELFVFSLSLLVFLPSPLEGEGPGGVRGLQDLAHSLGQEPPPRWTKLYACEIGNQTLPAPNGTMARDG